MKSYAERHGQKENNILSFYDDGSGFMVETGSTEDDSIIEFDSIEELITKLKE